MNQPLIRVRNLTVQFRTAEGLITAVDDVSYDIAAGETLGLVGESGSGKSVSAKSLMQLNASNAIYSPQSHIHMHWDNNHIDVLSLRRPKEMKIIRGGAISMIFQEPMASFAPAITVGEQMVEQLLLHSDLSKKGAKEQAISMLNRVGISAPAQRFKQYAFEFSGGMRQRAMIAMALSTQPKLLIADEPTTALDVTIQAQVLELMQDLAHEFGMGILFITHDIGVIAQTANRVAVMYLGRIVEIGPVRQVIRNPAHPYTQGLLQALPDLENLEASLQPIPGDIPSPLARPSGCVFHTRCAAVIEGQCANATPSMQAINDGHAVACFAVHAPDGTA